MFKGLIINLTERICDCEDPPTCYMHVRSGQFSGMGIKCKSCKTELYIPYDKLMPTFSYIEDLPPAKVINLVPNNDNDNKDDE